MSGDLTPLLNMAATNDPKMARLIARVGADAIAANVGAVRPPDNARLFDVLLKSITFSQISVDAGNGILRKLACGMGATRTLIQSADPNLTWFL